MDDVHIKYYINMMEQLHMSSARLWQLCLRLERDDNLWRDSHWGYYHDMDPAPPGSIIAEFPGMDLDELESLTKALEENPVGDVEQARTITSAKYHIFERTHNLEQLLEAIGLLQELLCSEKDKNSSRYKSLLRDMTVLLGRKFLHTGDLDYLELAVSKALELLDKTDLLHPDRYACWDGFSRLLQTFAVLSKRDEVKAQVKAVMLIHWRSLVYLPNPFTLDEGGNSNRKVCLQRLKEGLAVTPNEFRSARVLFSELGASISYEEWDNSDGDDGLDEAILWGEIAIRWTDILPAQKSHQLTRTARCLVMKSQQQIGNLESLHYLDKAVEYLEQATVIAVTSEERPFQWLCFTLMLRFQAGMRVSDFERALRIMEQPLRIPSRRDGTAGRVSTPKFVFLRQLLLECFYRYFNTDASPEWVAKGLKMLDRTIYMDKELVKYAFENAHDPDADAPRLVHAASEVLFLRSERNGQSGLSFEHLENSIRLEREALNLLDFHLERSRWRRQFTDHLVGKLLRRFFATTSAEHFDDLVKTVEGALSSLPNETDPEGYNHRARISNALTIALGVRYGQTGDRGLIDEAVSRLRQQVSTATGADRQHAMLQLAHISSRFAHVSSQLGIERVLEGDNVNAIDMIRQAISMMRPDEERKRSLMEFLLARTLVQRFEQNPLDNLKDLDEAIKLGQRSMEQAIKRSDSLKPLLASLLARLVYSRYRWARKGFFGGEETAERDLDTCITLARNAVKLTPATDVASPMVKNDLASYLWIRNNHSDIEEAITLCRDVMSGDGPEVIYQLNCAVTVVTCLRRFRRFDEAAQAAERGIRLLPKLGFRELKQKDQQHRLKELRFTNLPAIAVATLCEIGGDAGHCLELLEFGRGIINGLRLDSRVGADLSRLMAKHPMLAKRFTELRDELDQPTETDAGAQMAAQMAVNMMGAAPKPALTHRYDLAKQFERVTDEIRLQPGFHRFMQPPLADELKAVSTSQKEAVVVINFVGRCDAIIIQNGEIRHLHLKNARLEDINKHIVAIEDIHRNVGNSNITHDRRMHRVLLWLWQAIVGPILQDLGFTTVPAEGESWPRVWWVPIGGLTRYPLHAAGNHFSKNRGESALDRVVSSYSSSVKALLYALKNRRNANANIEQQSKGKIVLASMAKTPGASSLVFADREADELEKILKPAAISINSNSAGSAAPQNQTVRHSEPTKAEIISSLRSCSVFHFAGHGMSHLNDPGESCLLLKDWKTDPLTVKDLIRLNLHEKRPWLAYLSACSTGDNRDSGLFDESIHLMSAFQTAGFQNVIGSLWPISDYHSVSIAKDVYKALRDDIGLPTGDVALALHNAVRKLRDEQICLYGGRSFGDESEDEENEEEMIRYLMSDDNDIEMKDIIGISRGGSCRNERAAKLVKTLNRTGSPQLWAAYIHIGL